MDNRGTITSGQDNTEQQEEDLQILNLSDYASEVELRILQKGLTFSPTQAIDKFSKDLYLFLPTMFGVLYYQPSMAEDLAFEYRQTLQDLMDILWDSEEPTGFLKR